MVERTHGPLALAPADADRAARAFLTEQRALFALTSIDELATTVSEIDALGMLHVRLAQQYEKIPVWGNELRVHFDATGAIVLINGRYQPIADMAVSPTVASAGAGAIALAAAQALRPEVPANAFSRLAPSLWIFPASATRARLAWQVEVTVNDLAQPMRLAFFVDALDGAVLWHGDRYAHLDGSGQGVFGDPQLFVVAARAGQYWLEDATRGAPPQKIYSMARRTRLPGAEVQSASLTTWDQSGAGAGSAVDAAAYVSDAYDYFSRVHGRRGWDGNGSGMEVSVHFGTRYADAFFDGRGLVFGDGNDQSAPLAGGRDLVLHEYAHAVIDSTAALARDGQSGALAEAIADLFAVFATYDALPKERWKIGATVFSAGPLRDLSAPGTTGNPARISEYDANADVHVGSTVASHAGYLMTDGPGGIGVGAAERIWYRALAYYLVERSDFADAADATLAAAADLQSDWVGAVGSAWSAVGVR